MNIEVLVLFAFFFKPHEYIKSVETKKTKKNLSIQLIFQVIFSLMRFEARERGVKCKVTSTIIDNLFRQCHTR